MNNVIDGSTLRTGSGYYKQSRVYKETTETSKIEYSAVQKKVSAEVANLTDTVDIKGESRELPQAGYSKPIMKVSEKKAEEPTYKPIDANGIQEGVELSDKAKNLLKELQEKYGDNMDIYVANWSTDDEQDYYSGLSDKQFSALINPDLLEKMANDESVREKYESVLSSAGETSEKLKEELGEEVASNIKSFSVTIDADGKVSYMVQLLKDFTDKNSKSAKELQAEQLERLNEKKAEEKAKAKKEEKEALYEKITASSLEDLIAQIKEKYNISDITDTVDDATSGISVVANEKADATEDTSVE